ncbi:serine protease 55 [Melopsittacus undulatus]|uniref:serine protease 55 n=1 Tax=Melopsittacus undulatus TaxID=13146 RepID=UPI00146E8BE4|nr:serine protease 55 [Melopsittacus undulatus]
MLLFTLLCLTFLISSISAGISSQIFMFRNDKESRTAKCGLRPSYGSFQGTDKRFTKGSYAMEGEFPWHVSIQSNGRHVCGGTIISALWILTAAHCFGEEMPPDLTVLVGGIDLSVPLEEHKPDSLIVHEKFDRMSMQNDIALILLSSPIEFSNEKIPVCLPYMRDINMWQHCWIAGWGTTSAAIGRPTSHMMQKAPMKLISRQQCLKSIPQLVENMFCAEMEKRRRGAWQSQVDSGGPLVCSNRNTMKWFQVGIVSWKQDREDNEVLLSVYSYRHWIETETAIRGKPFFIEGVDNYANSQLSSKAEPQLLCQGLDIRKYFLMLQSIQLQNCFPQRK